MRNELRQLAESLPTDGLTRHPRRVVERLLKLADFLRERVPADDFDMSAWWFPKSEEKGLVQVSKATPCKTVACIAGWATAVFPNEIRLLKSGGIIHREFPKLPSDKALVKVLGICLACKLTYAECIKTPVDAANVLEAFAARIADENGYEIYEEAVS